MSVRGISSTVRALISGLRGRVFETRRWQPKLLFVSQILPLINFYSSKLPVVWQVADYQRARCDAISRVWHTQSRCTTNVKLCMQGGALPCHHHYNFKPWAHRTTTSGTITSHGRYERVPERVHEATTTPLIANTQSHTPTQASARKGGRRVLDCSASLQAYSHVTCPRLLALPTPAQSLYCPELHLVPSA